MCDFYLKGNCFHPEKSEKGMVASKCEVHKCELCTNKNWQIEQITNLSKYHQELLSVIKNELPRFEIKNEAIESEMSFSKIFS